MPKRNKKYSTKKILSVIYESSKSDDGLREEFIEEVKQDKQRILATPATLETLGNIIVADDQMINLAALKLNFAQIGINTNVEYCHDGAFALEKAL